VTKPALSLTEDQILTAIRTFLLLIVPDGVEVFKGQGNRVPEPIGVNFVVMTPTGRLRLSTNVVTWDRTDPDVDTLQHAHDVQFEVQLDIHGPGGSDIAGVIATLIRDEYACDQLDRTVVQPLYATDGHQMPFVNAEQQWENRWTMTAAFQILPIVSTDQQFAVTLTPSIVPIIGGLIP
jgi:hypothetical protein